MENYLRKWKVQKQNNKGSALPMVVIVIAIIGTLAMVLLSVTYLTYKMKITYQNSQKNFYDAESVLDDINVGLQQKVSDAAGQAYAWTLENYSGATDAVRSANYTSKFEEVLVASIKDTSYTDPYSLRYDVNILKAMVKDSADVTAGKAVYTVSSVGDPALNMNADGTYTIKNLEVTYVDNKDYKTVIKTDIILSCPAIDFTQKASAPLDLTTFALVANKQTNTSGGSININGSAYLGEDGTDFKTTNITFAEVGDTSRMITSGILNVYNGSKITVSQKCDTWAKDVNVTDAEVALSGSTYLSNDLVLGNNAKVSVAGELYAYGNPATATVTNDSALVNSNPADYSSAVLINGRETSLNLSGLTQMIISGNAYVNAKKNPADSSVIDENENIQMGESISLKADQRAYLVPAEFIAAYSEFGGRNPMLSTQFENLQEDIRVQLGYSSTTDIQPLDYLKSTPTSTSGVPVQLAQYGVVSIQKEIYPINNSGTTVSMVYFFLVFDGETGANNFAESYYAKEENLSTLAASLSTDRYDADILYPNSFANDQPESFTFYYNGCVVVPDNANAKVNTGKLSSISDSDRAKLTSQETTYQKMFAALSHKLVTDYAQLSSDELLKDVYTNLVGTSMSSTDPDKMISSGSKKVFATPDDPSVSASAQMCAVVVNGNYTVSKNGTESEAHETVDSRRLPVHVVIASGDVTVDCDFNGLIIAGGNIIISNKNITITADANLTQSALAIEDANGVRAADYLVDGDAFVIGSAGSGSSTGGGSSISFSDYVTYDNWMKQ